MIEIKDNTLIIILPEDSDKTIFNEIVSFANSKINTNKGKEILDLAEKYHKFDKDFKFKREEVYNERLYIH